MKKKILVLRPTQFALGMLEIDEKIKELSGKSKKELKKILRDTPVPVVLGPGGDYYVVDKHHFLFVCHSLGIEKVSIKVAKDLSRKKLTYLQFWRWMKKTRNSYPYCQFGEGPRKPYYLPRDIRGLADDPYRSLAWFVRKSGGFENTDTNFAEFKWANFFRSRNLLDREGLAGFEKAAKKAVRLSQSRHARRLPGFAELNSAHKREAEKKVKARVRRAHSK